MSDRLKSIEAKQKAWQERYNQSKQRGAKFMTVSSEPIKELYTPADIADFDFERVVAFTRSI
ncbi:MAG: methylmalonyl-CoA mutase, partial [Peptococcaceae bacterium]|nr:methylmalonyl-CoA mutase [Peptococcaceae bacterium]